MYNNKRLALGFFWVILGTALVMLSMLEQIDAIYCGMGGGFVVVGLMQIAKNIRYRTDERFREKVDIENHDERNRFLSMKAWSWTGYICILATACAVIACTVMGEKAYADLLLYVVLFMLFVYLITYMILKRKY